MSARSRSNPLALAVLATLNERPMHPYEISTVLRQRAKQESIRINFGSLYTVVESLHKRGFIRPLEVQREGRRPERTVYALTDAGEVELQVWLAELLSVPVKEYTQFEAALSLMPALPPEEVTALLRDRVRRLELELHQLRAVGGIMAERGIPRLFGIESEYWLALREAELAFVRQLVAEIERGTLDGLDAWRSYLAGHGDSVHRADDTER